MSIVEDEILALATSGKDPARILNEIREVCIGTQPPAPETPRAPVRKAATRKKAARAQGS